MKRILVPTDFSEQAASALQLAAEIAKKGKVELVLLHVVEIPGQQPSFNVTGEASSAYGDGMEGVFVMKMLERGKEKLRETANSAFLEGVSLRTELKAGNAYYNISTIVNELEPDLIVMGTSGSSGMEEILIGSNAEKVVRNASCPVLTLKEKISLSDINNVLFASSLKNDDMGIIASLKKILELSDAKIHLLKVNTPNNFESTSSMHKKMDEYMRKNGLEAQRHVYNASNEEEGILEFTKENNIDLIAMGTHGRKGLMHLLSGSIAEDVVNHSKRPVLTFKIED
ncbi:universal stress protein [Marivirga sp. S37H4]|uniref:Universal stress protein n=1 Tax=Marivirga aurantiaca TaxID=2802615 RepID=A0A935CAI6_9BACT|nr:universal stress protein [Marivirga aurantiaca]MBK6266786.1 universal stress protein [Marivirga aurantiaca]